MSEPVIGIGAGYLASRLMDKVTTAYQERQSGAWRRREKELEEVPAYVKAAERLAEIGGQNLDRALRVDPTSDGLSPRDARSRSPWPLNLRRRPGCALGGGQRAAPEKVDERGLRLAPLME
jgi:hypothetical protein